MEKKETFRYSFFLSLFFVPYLLTMAINGIETAILNRSPDPEMFIPVLAARQIPEDYQKEAIKAQTVIARTNFFRKIEETDFSRALQETGGVTENENPLWKLPASVYENAAEETKGQVLTANGKLKLVPYHEISGGVTRNGQEAFHDVQYSYLKSVDSSADKNSPFYLNSTYISQQQMPSSLNIREREASGYIKSLTADGNILEGEAFTRGMGLASANFSIQKIGEQIRFLCKGRGHGLGFSQNGGNEMAKGGSDWKKILETYFPEMELTIYER